MLCVLLFQSMIMHMSQGMLVCMCVCNSDMKLAFQLMMRSFVQDKSRLSRAVCMCVCVGHVLTHISWGAFVHICLFVWYAPCPDSITSAFGHY